MRPLKTIRNDARGELGVAPATTLYAVATSRAIVWCGGVLACLGEFAISISKGIFTKKKQKITGTPRVQSESEFNLIFEIELNDFAVFTPTVIVYDVDSWIARYIYVHTTYFKRVWFKNYFYIDTSL